jgi:competence protein ComFB
MKNLVEQAVREVHGQLLAKHTEFCSCAQCADDVVTLVLNQLRPRYTTSVSGWTLTHLELGSDQERADLAIRVLDAMRRVSVTPRHPPVRPDRPSR